MSVARIDARSRAPCLPYIKVLLRDLLDPLTYRRIAYLLLALPLGVIEFSFLVTAISFGVGTVITLIGIPVGTVYAWRWLAGLERRLIGALTGVQIASPYRPAAGGNWWQRLQALWPTRPPGRTSCS